MTGTAVEEIKARLDLAEVVGQHVPLRRSGRSLKGLCPFHAEKTPSFYVFPESGTWKCFGCGEGGDLFSFVQRRENLEFGEALRMLAGRAGVELPTRERQTPEAEAIEARLRSVLASAELFFRGALRGNLGSSARLYLEQRGVSDETADQFGLGYAPPSGLFGHLHELGFSTEEAAEVGLSGQRDDGLRYEMFRDRVIFPIRDGSGRTIGFGGRTMGDAQPKYLNGPQTRFFDKGNCLFGLDLARSALRETGQAIIVEGYFDVIIAHQAGFRTAVAPLGTALTERHLAALGRQVNQVVIALDADAAGKAATYRVLELALNLPHDAVAPVPNPRQRGGVEFRPVHRRQLKVLSLPTGRDPDEVIRDDSSLFGRLVSEAKPVVDFVVSRLSERYNLATVDGKTAAVQEAMQVIVELPDPIERDHYLQRLAAMLGMHESALRERLTQLLRRRRGPGRSPSSQGNTAGRNPHLAAVPEAYALALHYLLGSQSLLNANDCSTPEGRSIQALFAKLADAPRDVPNFDALAESVDFSLRPVLTDIKFWLSSLMKLSRDRLQRELEVARLKLRQERLRIEHRQALALAVEQDSREAGLSPAALLASIAAELQEVETALASRNGIGSLVWRSRHVGEVFGD